MDYTAIGQTVHLAGRMEQMAMPGSILMTADTLQLSRGLRAGEVIRPSACKGHKRTG